MDFKVKLRGLLFADKKLVFKEEKNVFLTILLKIRKIKILLKSLLTNIFQLIGFKVYSKKN